MCDYLVEQKMSLKKEMHLLYLTKNRAFLGIVKEQPFEQPILGNRKNNHLNKIQDTIPKFNNSCVNILKEAKKSVSSLKCNLYYGHKTIV